MSWIKMRIELQTHPKVVRILSAMRPQSVRSATDKFWIIGGLHAVWCVFDMHSEDGVLVGYTPEALDHIIGLPGIADAMMEVGWLEYDGAQTLTLPEFDEHNSQSAKRRAEDQKRKKYGRKSASRPQSVRNLSASEADISRKICGPEKEKEKEVNQNPKEAQQQASTVVGVQQPLNVASPVSRSVEIAVYLRQRGIVGANSANPNISAWGDDVRVTNEILDAALSVVASRQLEKPVGPNYLVGIIADLLPPKPAKSAVKASEDGWRRSPKGIESKASELGIYPRPGESHDALRERCESTLRKREQGAEA